jgi:hypothetical protein
MKFRILAAHVGVAAVAIGLATATAGPAAAINNIKPFGQQATINDLATGGPLIGYTVTGLSPSSDPVPHNGQLYEAPVVVDAFGVWANPVIPMFNARAESGQNYRVIGGGVPAAPPGGQTTGKLYFDVVGDVPNSVVYNDGGQDLLGWVSTGPMASGAPDVAGESTEIIPGAEAPAEATGDDVAPPVVPAPEEVSPFETPEQRDRGR